MKITHIHSINLFLVYTFSQALVNQLYTIINSRVFIEAELGEYFLFNAYVMLYISIVGFGLPTALRYYFTRWEGKQSLYYTVLVVQLCSCLLGLPVAFLIFWFDSSIDLTKTLLIIVYGSVFVFTLLFFNNEYLNGSKGVIWMSFYYVILPILIYVTLLPYFKFWSIRFVIYIFLFLLHVIVSEIFLNRRRNRNIDLESTSFDWKSIVRYSYPLVFAGLADFCLNHLDRIVVSNFYSNEALSTYGLYAQVSLLIVYFSKIVVGPLEANVMKLGLDRSSVKRSYSVHGMVIALSCLAVLPFYGVYNFVFNIDVQNFTYYWLQVLYGVVKVIYLLIISGLVVFGQTKFVLKVGVILGLANTILLITIAKLSNSDSLVYIILSQAILLIVACLIIVRSLKRGVFAKSC